MATLFQIRRGSGSVSLVDGEIYLHKGLSSLQVSLGTTPITLARLTDINYGSIYLQGDVTASNAYFSGDVSISGNLFLGNNTGDNISVPGVFTTNLVPGTNGTLDLGTSGAKWKTVWANTISSSFTGSVDGINITALSSSVNSRLTNLQNFTSSITGGVDKIAYFNEGKSLTSYNLSYLNSQTFGLGTSATSSGSPERLMVDNGGVNSFNIATFQTSKNDSYAQVNIKNFGSGSSSSTDLILWNDVATESSSYVDLGINSSNYSAGNVGFGGDGYLINAANDLYVGSATTGSHGHLHLFAGNLWNSSSLTIYQDGTIGINTDKLNNSSSTIPTAGFAVEISGSVKFDNNINIVGSISSSVITSIQSVTASLNTHSSSVDTKLLAIATLTGSLISSASADRVSVTNLNSYTASLNQAIQLTGSTVSFLGDIIVYGTQSIIHSTNLAVDDNIIYLNSTSSTTNIDFGIVGHYNDGTYRHGGVFRSATDGAWRVFKGYQPEISGAVNLSEATFQLADFKANDISSSTIVGIGNVTTYSASVDSRLTNLQSKSASVDNSVSLLGQYTQSQDTKNATLQTYTASVNSDLTIIHQTTASLNLFSASVSSSLSLIYQTTGSLNLFSASVSSSLSSIYVTTGSLVATASSHETRFASLATISGSLISSASSFETRFASLATISGSLIQTASLNTIAISNLNLETASLETRFATLGLTTGSLISATASLYLSSSDHERRLDELEYTTSVNLGNGAQVQLAAINLFTGSANTRLEALEAYSASYAQYFTYSGSKFHIDFNV
jgi:hypothetical protein